MENTETDCGKLFFKKHHWILEDCENDKKLFTQLPFFSQTKRTKKEA